VTLAALTVSIGAAGCTSQIQSSGAPSAVETTTPLPTSTVPPTAEATSTPTTTPTAPETTVTPETTATPETTIAPETTATPAPAPTPPPASVAPVVGQFACNPGNEQPTTWEVRPPSDIPSPPLTEGWRTAVFGRSVQGRAIEALVRPAATPRRRVVVIGGLHGNEPVTPPAVRGLLQADIDDDVEVWLVPVANPDGSAAGLRCNANGVDLNRNFAWEWSADDGGPAASSEPETKALTVLVEGLHPDVVVWIHQPLGYVSAIGPTADALEQAWSSAAAMPVRPDVTQHGGGESWSALVAGVPTLLVEIEGTEATPEAVAAQLAGFEAMLAALT